MVFFIKIVSVLNSDFTKIMKEPVFLKKNSQKWRKFEQVVTESNTNPDELAELFVQITDDLAYSRSQYPESKTTTYLNHLASNVYQRIYKNKKESKNRIQNFYQTELPLLFRTVHKELLYSFLIFALAVLIGVVSARYDENFVRLILGDNYVNMTIKNIKDGDPMAVYKGMGEFMMFVMITFNNVFVSFKVFAFGLLFSVGTVYILFMNGIMLGSFQYFFFKYGLLLESASTIWIHGTLEISAIVIAGAAGLKMGNSILFPQTYSRLASFVDGAYKGMKIIFGLVPVFIVAGFLESFVTRYTGMPIILKLLIIVASLGFIIYYFVIYPIVLENSLKNANNPENQLELDEYKNN